MVPFLRILKGETLCTPKCLSSKQLKYIQYKIFIADFLLNVNQICYNIVCTKILLYTDSGRNLSAVMGICRADGCGHYVVQQVNYCHLTTYRDTKTFHCSKPYDISHLRPLSVLNFALKEDPSAGRTQAGRIQLKPRYPQQSPKE